MSNGIDSLANGNSTDISNILRQTPDSMYEGTNFTGQVMPNQNVFDVGPGQMTSPAMFGTDSINPIGAEAEESSAHEMTEPKGPHGEDID